VAGLTPQHSTELKKSFFSEEKKQKTFVPPQLPTGSPWHGSIGKRRNKSLLVLFFRKEHLP
jgi:hypothetical protein